MLLSRVPPGGLTRTKAQKKPMPTMMPGIERGKSMMNESTRPALKVERCATAVASATIAVVTTAPIAAISRLLRIEST